jgi:hypothetical protein
MDKEYTIEFEGLQKFDEATTSVGSFQFYLKRKGKYFFRDKNGTKISFSGSNSPKELDQLKLGDWYECKVGIE